MYDRVFLSARGQLPAKKHDLFRVFMILAIGSIIPFRKGSHQSHPMGYYLAAMQNWTSSLLANGSDTIQDLLLVCRFAIYHQIGSLMIPRSFGLACAFFRAEKFSAPQVPLSGR